MLLKRNQIRVTIGEKRKDKYYFDKTFRNCFFGCTNILGQKKLSFLYSSKAELVYLTKTQEGKFDEILVEWSKLSSRTDIAISQAWCVKAEIISLKEGRLCLNKRPRKNQLCWSKHNFLLNVTNKFLPLIFIKMLN